MNIRAFPAFPQDRRVALTAVSVPGALSAVEQPDPAVFVLFGRRLLIHGARSCLTHMDLSRERLGNWLSTLLSRTHVNKVTVALLASGADAFLTKPIDFTIVRNEIDMRIRQAVSPLTVFDGGIEDWDPEHQAKLRQVGLRSPAAGS